MQTIEFKRQGILYFLRKHFWINDPVDTCQYKGHLIISIITILMTFPVFIIRNIIYAFIYLFIDYLESELKEMEGLKTYIMCFLFTITMLVCGVGVIEGGNFLFDDFIYWHKLSWLSKYLYSYVALGVGIIGFLILIIGFLIALAIIYLIWTYILETVIFSVTRAVGNEFDYYDGEEPKTQVGTLYRSAKERWCKKINWK